MRGWERLGGAQFGFGAGFLGGVTQPESLSPLGVGTFRRDFGLNHERLSPGRPGLMDNQEKLFMFDYLFFGGGTGLQDRLSRLSEKGWLGIGIRRLS